MITDAVTEVSLCCSLFFGGGGYRVPCLCSTACFVQKSTILTVRCEICIMESHRRSICCYQTRNSATACEVMMMSTKKNVACAFIRGNREGPVRGAFVMISFCVREPVFHYRLVEKMILKSHWYFARAAVVHCMNCLSGWMMDG